jgi:hypothetical protein
MIYVRTAAPEGALGATNGLAQTSISVVRAIGPAASTSLYALSVQYNILGGWFVYLVLTIIAVGALGASVRLPENLWTSEEENAHE